MKKKIIALFLATAMVFSLAACGDSGDGDTSTDDAATADDAGDDAGDDADDAGDDAADDADDSSTSSGDGDLTVWCWDPAFNLYAMEEAEKVYQQDNPDFSLNIVETPWDDIQTKVTTAATAGDLSTLPDILLMQDMAFQKNLANYPEVFSDLTDTSIDFSNFAEAKASYSSLDGKHYGVPFDNGASIAVYRTDVLDQAGYTIDDLTDITWSEFIEIGKDVLEQTGMPLLSAQAGSPDLLSEMFQSAGGDLFNEDGNPNIVGNDAILEAMENYVELVTSGVMIEVNDWDQYIASMNGESVAGVMNGCWIMASIQQADEQSGLWAVTNMPRLDNHPDATQYSNQGGSSWVVTSNCENVELAADFLGSTFGGSTEFYDTILSAGALATYLPAGDSDAYAEPSEFFSGEAVFSKITEFAGQVPSSITGVYFYEARDALGVALTNCINGGDIADELQGAEDEVNFQMGN